MTELYFVRHCEPVAHCAAVPDVSRELTERGRADTEAVTAYLESVGADTVISSPFVRAVQTVEPFARKHGLKIEKCFDLSERRLDIVLDSETFLPYVSRQWSDFSYREADGECLREVERRCTAAVEDILERCQMKKVAIGCHGTALCTIIRRYAAPLYFGFEQFMALVDTMPFVAHLSFFGDKCENIEIIDPCAPAPAAHCAREVDRLTYSVPSAADVGDIESLRREFVVTNNDFILGGIYSQPDEYCLVRRARDGRLIGILSVAEVYGSSRIYCCIRPSDRWKGYGGAALRQALQSAMQEGVGEMLLSCDSLSIPSRKLIEGAGGELVNMKIAPVDVFPSGLERRYRVTLKQ